MQLLENKSAIITGAGRGIGKAIVEVFVHHGAKVMVGDIDLKAAEELAKNLCWVSTDSAAAVQLDISDPASVANAIDKTTEVFGRLDILVNNAGVYRSHPFLEFPVEDFDYVYSVNSRGTFLCAQAAAKQMVRQGNGGSIISIASASGKKPDQGGAAYNSSKSAIIGLTRVMALELGEYQIRVNCILPGATDTEMLKDVFRAEPGLKKILENRTPLGKIAMPEDQANAAVFLASDMASHITGEQLVVSGGEFMDT